MQKKKKKWVGQEKEQKILPSMTWFWSFWINIVLYPLGWEVILCRLLNLINLLLYKLSRHILDKFKFQRWMHGKFNLEYHWHGYITVFYLRKISQDISTLLWVSIRMQENLSHRREMNISDKTVTKEVYTKQGLSIQKWFPLLKEWEGILLQWPSHSNTVTPY